MYRLKPGFETFTPASKDFEGITFVRGNQYKEIPPEFESRFEKVKPAKKEKGVKNAVDKSKS